MENNKKDLIKAFKRMIHILSTGNNKPVKYGKVELYRAEVHILEIIEKNEGIIATGITQMMAVTKGAVSQIITKLQKKGLIIKKDKGDNLKIKELFLTEKGKEVIKYHEEREKALIMSLGSDFETLKDEDIKKFTNIINRVSEHIVEK